MASSAYPQALLPELLTHSGVRGFQRSRPSGRHESHVCLIWFNRRRLKASQRALTQLIFMLKIFLFFSSFISHKEATNQNQKSHIMGVKYAQNQGRQNVKTLEKKMLKLQIHTQYISVGLFLIDLTSIDCNVVIIIILNLCVLNCQRLFRTVIEVEHQRWVNCTVKFKFTLVGPSLQSGPQLW